MDLWTLPLGSTGTSSHYNDIAIPLVAHVVANAHANLTTQIAFFAHTVQNKANSIRFAHQSLCSPCILTLLKAIRRGYLKGCPNLTAKGVTKYLNPSPATAKGHMRHPCQGIKSTRRGLPATTTIDAYLPSINGGPINDDNSDNCIEPAPAQCTKYSHSNIINHDNTPGAANLFCFAAFADKQTGTLYNDLIGSFPFMALEGKVCFLIVYHYETNAIVALPIVGFGNDTIFAAYKNQYELLKSKGYFIKLNVIDNQASHIIKQFLTLKQCAS